MLARIGILMILILASCRSNRQVVNDTVIAQRDSVATRTEAFDSIIVARPADIAQLSEDIAKLSEQGKTTKSGSATLTVRRSGDQVEATCECDELKEAVKLYREIIERYRETETTTTVDTKDKFNIKDILIYLLWIAAIWKGGDVVLQLIRNKND